ncbi:hypothetical protein LXA43DRAFT_499911 [Ganoderma leucocontextum]|nr:hypothetical protein LXA43DRAFT_499911 [Ganoderma leucocontextum]
MEGKGAGEPPDYAVHLVLQAASGRPLAVQSVVGMIPNGQSAFATVAHRNPLADYPGCRRRAPTPYFSPPFALEWGGGGLDQGGPVANSNLREVLLEHARRLTRARRTGSGSGASSITGTPGANHNNNGNKYPKAPADRARGEARYGYVAARVESQRAPPRQTWRDILAARMPRAVPSGPPGLMRTPPPHNLRRRPGYAGIAGRLWRGGGRDRLMGDGEVRGLSHRTKKTRVKLCAPQVGSEDEYSERGGA